LSCCAFASSPGHLHASWLPCIDQARSLLQRRFSVSCLTCSTAFRRSSYLSCSLVMLTFDLIDRPTSVQFTELLAAHGLTNHVILPTHGFGGMLNVVASRVDLPPLLVDVHDVGLSDHRLLQRSAPLMRPAPVYTTTTSRPWARLDADAFRAALLACTSVSA